MLSTWEHSEKVHEWCGIQVFGRDSDGAVPFGRSDWPCSCNGYRSSRFPLRLQGHAYLVQLNVHPGRVQFRRAFRANRIRENLTLQRLKPKLMCVNCGLC